MYAEVKFLLYGLIKFPKNWFDWLSYSLTNCGFHLIESDFCLFVIEIVICLIYVDACLFGFNQGDNIDETIQRVVDDNLNLKLSHIFKGFYEWVYTMIKIIKPFNFNRMDLFCTLFLSLVWRDTSRLMVL